MRAWHGLLRVALALLAAMPAHAAPPDTGLDERLPRPSPAPTRLVITVVTGEPALPTFEQRVSSWFSDGTQVTVSLARAVAPELLLATPPGEVRVYVVPRGTTRALVTFATPDAASSRHLLRDVHLRDGFDEIGLERLASVIHTACLALREGVEGAGRAAAERELVEVGLIEPKIATPAPALVPSLPSRAETAPPPRAPRGLAWLIGAQYGARARGGEGWGQGPGALLGLQLPSARGAIDVLLSAQVLLPSAFDAGPLRVSLQTTALRAELGIEPALSGTVFLQAVLGGGVDVARIRPSERSVSGQQLRVDAREPGSQWRGVGELALGVFERTGPFELGVVARCSFLLGDVHYTLVRSSDDERLVTPWPVQPSLALQARFGGPL